MQERRKLAHRVLQEGVPVAEAARDAGVSRVTAYQWIGRARRDGVAQLQELSRRPLSNSRVTAAVREAQEQVLALKAKRPAWGAKKLHAYLWPPLPVEEAATQQAPAPVCVRTVDRWLKQHDLVRPRSAVAAPQRFERAQCNQLWQLDFKGLERSWGYRPLSLLDDRSRFCLRLEPVVGFTLDDYWSVLWQALKEYGLPEAILCDNGDGFNSTQSPAPTAFQARLWRLGIATWHGRPSHPQTQGKVERFHCTLEDEWGEHLRHTDVSAARKSWPHIVGDYNWMRPHEALGGRVPGSMYAPSPRARPDQLPEAVIVEDKLARKVDANGRIHYRSQAYHLGRGLAGEWVELREEEDALVLFFANHRIAPLTQLSITRSNPLTLKM